MEITVCVATFRRNSLLKNLIESLSLQSFVDMTKIRVFVVDNDPCRGAEDLVLAMSNAVPFALTYFNQPERGISAARNFALEHVETSWVAFIDDDELADPDWLAKLAECSLRFSADVVFGAVTPAFPEGSPPWAPKLAMYKVNPGKIGTEMAHGATNNVLMNWSKVRSLGIRFDPAFALTGGSDTEFFSRLHRAGCKMVWCPEARVSEIVPSERLKIAWIMRRGFRGGQSFARIFYGNEPSARRAYLTCFRVLYLLGATTILPIFFMRGREHGIDLIQRMAGWCGQLTILLGSTRYYREYLNDKGRSLDS